MIDQSERPTATIGHNMPPKSPYEISKEAIESLFDEAKNWLDGEPIVSQEQADEVQKLMRLIQSAAKDAEAARKEEARPFDEGKAEVQARYNPLIQDKKGKADLAIASCKKALVPWLEAVDAETRRIADIARKEAEEKQRLAMEAFRNRDSLEAAENAERLADEAKRAEAEARKAGNAKASAKGEGRAVTLRDHYTPEITNATEFARHVWLQYPDEMATFLNTMAVKLVAAGRHNGIPGVTVHHERRAQ